jgi:hypothetical protein
MKTTFLKFSEPFMMVQYLEDIVNYKIKGKTILLNVGKKPVLIEGMPLKPWHSSIFADVSVPHAQNLISIVVKPDVLSPKEFKYSATLRKNGRMCMIFFIWHATKD